MNKCINCKYADLTSRDYPCYVCEDNDRFEGAETKRTNYEKIIENGVESLAEFLQHTMDCSKCCVFANYWECEAVGNRVCKDCIKEWLQKECEE